MEEGSTRTHYTGELERLQDSGLGGLDMVVSAIERTLESIQHQDIELAAIVIADDDRIDGRYLEVHQSLITLLATQSPVATDLRQIAALMHVMKNIERMGDQCVNICKMIPLSGNDPPADEEMISRLVLMGQARTDRGQAGEAVPSSSATSRWPATWCARTTSSTTSTGSASTSPWRSATTRTGASGR